MTSEVRSINCPACGAGQTILGGGRVETHVCPYCGSALDALRDFAILARHDRRKRADTPLQLGAQGTIRGVGFTVIGIAGWREEYRGQVWAWTDHQVYSPTHGYGWITREDTGHWTFTRKLRKYPRHWVTPTSVETSESRPYLWIDGERLAYYETSTARIDSLEGAFNWQPKVGETAQMVTFVGEGRMITLSGTTDEREVEETRLLTPDEQASFGIDARPKGRHPLAIEPRWRHHEFVVAVSAIFIVLTLFASILQDGSGGKQLANTGEMPTSALPIQIDFDTEPWMRLAKLQLRSDVNDGWAYFDIELENDEGDTILGGGRELSYYSGVDNEGAWTEGSRNGSLVFPVEGHTHYTMTIEMPEYGSGETGTLQTNHIFRARVVGLSFSWLPLAATVGVFALFLAATLGWELRRRRRMLAGSDWTED